VIPAGPGARPRPGNHPRGRRPATELYLRGVYRFLLTRQWVVLTLVGLFLMPAMVELGLWQMHRHESEDASNSRIAHSLAAAPVPLERLTAPGARIPAADNFRSVTATGTYDAARQVVVRHRTSGDDSTIGYYLVTPLVLTDGRAVLVNRGWIAAKDDVTHFPPVPATPKGTVRLTGRIRPDETTASTGIRDTTGLPPRQVMLINGAKLAGSVPEPLVGGYLELTGTSPRPPAGQPQTVPAPTPGQTNGGYNPPHLAYAWQWWLFVAMVPAGWIILVRRERRDRIAQRDKAAAEQPAADPPSTAAATGTANAAASPGASAANPGTGTADHGTADGGDPPSGVPADTVAAADAP
jgi:cytochrome oxidase assembly protein ShyY1